MVKQVQVGPEIVIPLKNGAALVASHSELGSWHAVKNGQCDCKGYQYRHACRHLRAVVALGVRDDQNALVHEQPQRDPLFLNERPPAPRPATPRTFEEIFGVPPAA